MRAKDQTTLDSGRTLAKWAITALAIVLCLYGCDATVRIKGDVSHTIVMGIRG